MRANRLLLLLGFLILIAGPLRAEEDERTMKDADDKLKAIVNVAIDRGAKWLAKQQAPGGEFKSGYDVSYPMGPTALATLALLHSGVPRDDPVIRKAFAYLRRNYDAMKGRAAHSGMKVYSVSVTIMALAELSREAGRRGAADARYGRGGGGGGNLADTDREWMKDLTQWLVKNQSGGAWRYPLGGFDHSNSQYALLALKEARRCGIAVPDDTFARSLRHFMAKQEKSGPRVPRYVEKGGDGVYAASKTRAPGFDHARGWGYTQPPPTGSMTAAGVTAVAICAGELRARQYRSLVAKAEQSRRDGLAWLGRNFSVRENPPVGRAWHFYYLYGLERAGVLSGVVYMGEHRWYAKGARYLVDSQGADGRWMNDNTDHSFALLFLVRATARALGPVTERPLTDLTRADKLPDRELGNLFTVAFDEMAALKEEAAKDRARDFALFGPRVIPLLLTKLHDGREDVRARGAEILRAVTGLAFGFDAAAAAAEREAATDRWTAWWLKGKDALKLDREARRVR